MQRFKVSSSCVLALAFAMGPLVFASDATTASPPDTATINTLDEVVVTGHLTTLSDVQKAMAAAADRFYKRFNEVNKDHKYDLLCRSEAPTGRRVKTSSCEMSMVDDLAHDEVMKYFIASGGPVGSQSAAAVQRFTLPTLREQTREVLRTDPELRLALLQHAKLQLMYEEMRKQKHEQHIVVVN